MMMPWSPPPNATACPSSGQAYTLAHRHIRGKEHPALCVIDPVDGTLVSIYPRPAPA